MNHLPLQHYLHPDKPKPTTLGTNQRQGRAGGKKKVKILVSTTPDQGIVQLKLMTPFSNSLHCSLYFSIYFLHTTLREMEWGNKTNRFFPLFFARHRTGAPEKESD